MNSVNNPSHYNSGKIEVIDYIEDQKLNFNLGNCVKYISRAGKKDPNKKTEDLKKALWYLKRELNESDLINFKAEYNNLKVAFDELEKSKNSFQDEYYNLLNKQQNFLTFIKQIKGEHISKSVVYRHLLDLDTDGNQENDGR